MKTKTKVKSLERLGNFQIKNEKLETVTGGKMAVDGEWTKAGTYSFTLGGQQCTVTCTSDCDYGTYTDYGPDAYGHCGGN